MKENSSHIKIKKVCFYDKDFFRNLKLINKLVDEYWKNEKQKSIEARNETIRPISSAQRPSKNFAKVR